MRFVIYGASVETGLECQVIIEAPTPSAAEEQAQLMRIAVSRLEVAPVEPPPVSVAGVVTTLSAQPYPARHRTGTENKWSSSR